MQILLSTDTVPYVCNIYIYIICMRFYASLLMIHVDGAMRVDATFECPLDPMLARLDSTMRITSRIDLTPPSCRTVARYPIYLG